LNEVKFLRRQKLAVKIRLMRFGKKKQPTYRIVVTDQRNARNGEYIEKLGFYNPIKGEIKIEKEKIDLWVKKGAQLAESVKNLLKKVN